MAPDVHFTRSYPEIGLLTAIMTDDTASPPRFAYLSGIQIQGNYRLHAMKVDSLGSPEWTRITGNADHMLRAMRLHDSTLAYLGYTTATASQDYRLIRLRESGLLDGSYPFGGNTTDETGYAMRQRTSGKLLVVGETQLHPDSARRMSLVQVSIGGIVDWARTLTNASVGMGVAVRGDSVILIFGTADSTSASGSDFIMVRTDSVGLNPVYRRFSGTGNEVCADVVRLSEDFTLMAGSVKASGSDAWDIFVLATNDAGDSLWSRRYGTHADDQATAMTATMDRDSGFVIAGWSDGGPSGQRRGMLLKLNRQGDSLWTLFTPEAAITELNDVIQDSEYRYQAVGFCNTDLDHGYYLVTEPDPHSPGTHPPQQFSLLNPADHSALDSSNLRFEWEQSFDPDSADTILYYLQLDFDTLFESAVLEEWLDTNYFAWMADTDDVDLFWRVTALDRQGHTRLCQDRFWEFNLAVPDSMQEFRLLFPDSGMMLPRPLTEFRWTRAADADRHDTVTYAIHFVVGDTGMTFPGLQDTFINVSFVNNPLISAEDTVLWYVTAASHQPPMTLESNERWTFYGWDLAADESAELALEFGLEAPFPNPFNASTTLRYTVEHAETVRLDIFNIEGRLTATVASGMHTPGRYETQWDARNAASGVYFARLIGGNEMRTAKLLLLK